MLKLVLREGSILAVAGTLLGLAGAFALTRPMKNLLFAISPTDALTYISVSALLITVALLASFLPARRAASVQPMEALRYE